MAPPRLLFGLESSKSSKPSYFHDKQIAYSAAVRRNAQTSRKERKPELCPSFNMLEVILILLKSKRHAQAAYASPLCVNVPTRHEHASSCIFMCHRTKVQ